MDYTKENMIVKKTFDFALNVIDFSELLDKDKKYNVSKQFFRAGTSVGANVSEAQNSESLKDFVHKFKIAAKEIEETIFWISLCNASAHYRSNLKLLEEAVQIRKVLTKIISTSKNKFKTEN